MCGLCAPVANTVPVLWHSAQLFTKPIAVPHVYPGVNAGWFFPSLWQMLIPHPPCPDNGFRSVTVPSYVSPVNVGTPFA